MFIKEYAQNCFKVHFIVNFSFMEIVYQLLNLTEIISEIQLNNLIIVGLNSPFNM